MSTISELETKDDWDQALGDQTCTKDQIEQAVIFMRLELYNRDLPCGPKAVRQRLEAFYHAKRLPPETTIARILSRNGLTHSRTGLYE
jgi:putative transposase